MGRPKSTKPKVKKPEATREALNRKRTVYEICNDEFVRARLVNDEFLTKKHKGIKIKDGKVYVDVEKYEGAPTDVFTSRGVAGSADEVLGSQTMFPVEIPFKDRHEFKDIPLPDSELLKVLHYYASHRQESQKLRLTRALDDSALLGLGMLVEKWADDMVTREAASMFVENQSEDEKEGNKEDMDHMGDVEDEDGKDGEKNTDSEKENTDDENLDNINELNDNDYESSE